ncbi:unnamed protein product, partial [Ixodes hexagonus]
YLISALLIGLVAVGVVLLLSTKKSSPRSPIPGGIVTSSGIVVGENATVGSISIGLYFGIPYGRTTAGDGRFAMPVALDTFPRDGTFEAYEHGEPCSQLRGGNIVGSEDCLRLSIWAPLAPSADTPKKTVVVVLTGDLYQTTSSSDYDWSELAATGDHVVVAPNHRVGVMGFLIIPGVPEGVALEDLMQALDWIKRNVASFHGYPNRVVALGLGSGAGMLTMSIMRSNFFYKAILLGLSPRSIISVNNGGNSKIYQQALAESLGCNADREDTRLECLRSATQEALLGASVSNALYPLRFVPPKSTRKLTVEAIRGMEMIIGDAMDIGDALFEDYIVPFAQSRNAKTTFDVVGAMYTFIKNEKMPSWVGEPIIAQKFPSNSTVKDFVIGVMFCASMNFLRELHSLNATGYHFLLTKSEQLFQPALNMTDISQFFNTG